MSTLQIELDDQQKSALDSVAAERGVTPQEFVRDAVINIVRDRIPSQPWKAAWRQAAGMWKDRDDIPDLIIRMRKEWNQADASEDQPK